MDKKLNVIDIFIQVAADFLATIPSILGAILVILVGWLLAKLLARATGRVLSMMSADKAADAINKIDILRQAKVKIVPSKLIPKTVFYLLMLIVVMIATEVLQIPVFSKMMGDLISFIPNVIVAICLFIFGIVLADFLKNITLAACNSLGIPSGRVIANFIFYLIFLTLTISALEQASIKADLIKSNLTVLVAGLVAAFSIGYGLASKNTMANYLASFYTKNKVKLGDVIRLDGEAGEVVAMDGSSLTIESQTENKLVVIPLKRIASENLEILRN